MRTRPAVDAELVSHMESRLRLAWCVAWLVLVLGAAVSLLAPRPVDAEETRAADALEPAGAPGVDTWIERLHDSEREIERLRASGAGAGFRPRTTRPFSTEATLGMPPNVLVNSKIGDGFASAQVEPSIAMMGPMVLCAFNTDKLPSGGDGMNAEFNFTSGFGPWLDVPLPPAAGPMSKWIADPVVSVNPKTMKFYFSGLFTPTGMPGTTDGIAVAHGTFSPGGPSGPTFTWSPPVVVRSGAISSIIFDKDWMVADSSSGNLYLTYTSYNGATTSDSILFQRSTDGGATWGAPITMIGVSPALVQGSRVAVGPGGEVYVAWFHAAGPPDLMQIRKSTDHGLTFGPVKTVASVFSDYGTGGPGSNLNYAPNFPSLAVDRSTGPHRGRVYLSCTASADYTSPVLGTAGSKSELAPSGSWMHATPFTPGEILRGSMPTSDVDSWSFFAELGHTYVFNADSLPTGFGALIQITCSDSTQPLVAGTIPAAIGGGKPNITTFSPFMPGEYFIKLYHYSTGVAGYRIKTGEEPFPPLSPFAPDERDVVAMHSDDGSTWSAPVKVNIGPPGFDQLMPEIGVSIEGYPYTMWLDTSPSMGPCMPKSDIQTARSTDGGTIWITPPVLSDSDTDWDGLPSDIIPNQGDYLAISAGDGVGYAFTDGRLGDPDIFFSSLFLFSGTTCGADSTLDAGSFHTRTWTVSNGNPMFDNSYTCTLTCDRAWPGFPTTTSLSLAPTSGGPASLSFEVPDSAAAGVVHMTFQVAQFDGPVLFTCAHADTVHPSTLAVGPGVRVQPQLALGRVWPNPGPGTTHIAFTLPDAAPATLEMFDLSGRQVWNRAVGDMGAGEHTLALDGNTRALPPGLYAVRLRHGASAVSSRVILMH